MKEATHAKSDGTDNVCNRGNADGSLVCRDRRSGMASRSRRRPSVRQTPADAEHGQTFDHHFIEFIYANGMRLFSQCRYIPGCWERCGERATGTKGQAVMSGWGGGEGGAWLSGEKPWRYRGPRVNPWDREQVDLIAAIRQNRPYHEGWYGATSSFTGVLRRTDCLDHVHAKVSQDCREISRIMILAHFVMLKSSGPSVRPAEE